MSNIYGGQVLNALSFIIQFDNNESDHFPNNGYKDLSPCKILLITYKVLLSSLTQHPLITIKALNSCLCNIPLSFLGQIFYKFLFLRILIKKNLTANAERLEKMLSF